MYLHLSLIHILLVAIALLPASAFGVWNFGLPAFGMLVTTTVVAVLTEYIYEKLMHKKITINDWSAAVTGLLLLSLIHIYQVYSKDELNMVGDRVELSGSEKGKPEKDNGR